MKKNNQPVTACKTYQVTAGLLKEARTPPAGHLPHWGNHRNRQSETTTGDYYDGVILPRTQAVWP